MHLVDEVLPAVPIRPGTDDEDEREGGLHRSPQAARNREPSALARARALAAAGRPQLTERHQSDLEQARTSFQALAGVGLRHSNEWFLCLAQTAFAAQKGEATTELERRKAAVGVAGQLDSGGGRRSPFLRSWRVRRYS